MEFELLCRESNRINEKSDCAVKAVALVTNNDYHTSHQTLTRCGRAFRKGTPFSQTLMALKELGYRAEVVQSGPLMRIKTVRKLDRPLKILPKDPYLIRVNKHILAAVNGKVQDWTEGRCHRILEIYKIHEI